MTIEECYQQMGGNINQVMSRLPSQKLVEKFVVKFLDDLSFSTLCEEMEKENRQEAFRAAHTLKGVCANLSFDRLQNSASRLTEVLRIESDTIPEEAWPLMDEVRTHYQCTVDAIHGFQNSK